MEHAAHACTWFGAGERRGEYALLVSPEAKHPQISVARTLLLRSSLNGAHVNMPMHTAFGTRKRVADGSAAPKRRRKEEAIKQIARLTVERGQTLRYASVTNGKRVAVFFAPKADPTLNSNYELLRCALDEARVTATYFDVSRLADVARLKHELARTDGLVVLDDEAFRAAPFAKTNVICACLERADLD